MTNSTYFFLEPYVHIFQKQDHALLYNELNGETLEYRGVPAVSRLLKRLLAFKNSYVVKMSRQDLEEPAVGDFVRAARERFMGDLLDAGQLSGKPFQIPPRLKVHNEPHTSGEDDNRETGKNIKRFLSDLSIYINGSGTAYAPKFKDAYKQFLCPRQNGSRAELPVQTIDGLLAEASGSPMGRLNILGGDIFQYSQLPALIASLDNFPADKYYYLHYGDAALNASQLALLKETGTFKDEAEPHNYLELFADFPVNGEWLVQGARAAMSAGIPFRFNFILEKEDELEFAEQIISRFRLEDYSLLPYYNGGNLEFFREAVFITREAVLAARPGKKDIFARQVIDQTHFGSLTVLNNGAVHANVNAPALGKSGRDSPAGMLHKEAAHGKSWRRNRGKIPPCKGCVYQYLCPSPSNYERVMGKNNLCRIWTGNSPG